MPTPKSIRDDYLAHYENVPASQDAEDNLYDEIKTRYNHDRYIRSAPTVTFSWFIHACYADTIKPS